MGQTARGRVARGSPARWVHTEGVARPARVVARVLRLGSEGEVLVAAAYLHDVGYASDLRCSGFHPLDGAMHLRSVGQQRLARLVAQHSGARWEAEARGLGDRLSTFEREASVVADALTYCDLTTGPSGARVTPSQRLADIEERHGVDSLVVEAIRQAVPELRRAVSRIEDELSGAERYGIGAKR